MLLKLGESDNQHIPIVLAVVMDAFNESISKENHMAWVQLMMVLF